MAYRADTIGGRVEIKIVEQLGYSKIKMRYWRVYLDGIHIGHIGYNTESNNVHFKVLNTYSYPTRFMVTAIDMVKSQLVEEVLLE